MQDQVVPSMTSPNSENASAIFFSVLEKDKPAAKLLVQATGIACKDGIWQRHSFYI
jgi:hypothetical protein